MEDKIKQLEKEIEEIKMRNQKVEGEKAWETSFFRMTTILILTYFIAAWVMKIIGVENFFANALIPTLGYFLSAQSLPFIKKWWMKKRWKKN